MSNLPDWVPEKSIEMLIINYLRAKGVFCWKNYSIGVYDPRLKCYRPINSKMSYKGVSDIIGIFKGMPLFIEVKKSDGRLRPDQKVFLDMAKQNGAIAFVARDLSDVQKHLGI